MKQFVEVHYYVRPGMRQAFYDALSESGIPAASRAEAGNVQYDYYFSPEQEDELLLLELWQDAEAVRLHGETPHFKALGALKAEYVTDTVIRRYTVEDA
ncbi:MAG: antibiotic biosynthesis monooxygenase [Oscillospiraceae bacterium]|nr:antibiotic biosynthesis monooxygenase [Oscillospiraceae bacterium]MBR1898552.1 antibiotic biosynthesis monooxygenase [Oscillospiraceae bacterium]